MRQRSIVILAAALLVLTASACGHPRQQECPEGEACVLVASPTTPFSQLVATAAIASPTPVPPTPGSPSPTARVTATLMPPDPRFLTSRPTDPPYTPRPRRPTMPVAADIKLGSDGKYYADVDGCHWSETTHGGDPASGSEWVVLQTPCLPYEGLHFYPATRAVDYFIR